MTDNGTQTQTQSPTGQVPEQVIPDMDLGELLSDAIRKAVTAQINGQAKDIASGVVADMLTPEVIAGMRETAIHETEKALNPPPAPEPEPEPEPELEAEEEEELPPPPPKYATAKEFVEEYVVQVYRREVTERGAEDKLRWCPEWWKHGEATARFEAMHRAFESLRQGESVEPSLWWLVHFDPHMERLFDPETGPFRYCSPATGHSDKLRALPVVPAPPGIFGSDDQLTPSGLLIPTTSPGAVHRRQIMEFP